MLGVTRLLCDEITSGEVLRYGGRETAKSPAHLLHYSKDKRPIVVWNVTRRCNLRCLHCYSDSENRDYGSEISTREALRAIDGLAEFGVPTLLFSGGEPLLRGDLFELCSHARTRGIRTVLSTNGTFISENMAAKIRDAGFSYVGVSIDGTREVHDRFRQSKGSFEKALLGIRNCRALGIRVGLRFTVSKLNLAELPAVMDLLETEDIPRCCVYHLAYAGRGDDLSGSDLTAPEARGAVDLIFDRAKDFHLRGIPKDILTVDNHTDNVFLLMRVMREQPHRAQDVEKLLQWNGGNQSGIAIAAIDWEGNVHPDQFSLCYSLGNVLERSFREIWTNPEDPILAGLKNRKSLLKGRCGACRYLDICNGNLRIRAWSATGDYWAPDPACYLTDEEIGVSPEELRYVPSREFPGSDRFSLLPGRGA